MSPRAYDLGRRSAGVAQTRSRIVESARRLLASSTTLAEMSIPAIAREADVSRDTIYRQFTSRSGLLEAVFDDSAERGGLGRLVDAVTAPAALDGLDTVVTVFCGYWSQDLPIHRALRALAALDPDLAEALRGRDGRRRIVLALLCGRLAEERPDHEPLRAGLRDRTIDLLHVLTGFETYAQLRSTAEAEDVRATVRRAVRDVLRLPAAGEPARAGQ